MLLLLNPSSPALSMLELMLSEVVLVPTTSCAAAFGSTVVPLRLKPAAPGLIVIPAICESSGVDCDEMAIDGSRDWGEELWNVLHHQFLQLLSFPSLSFAL